MVPNFIHKDIKQTTFISVSFEDQILPGAFEHTIHVLVEKYLDLTIFHPRYKNSDGGRPAYDPAVLLKVVLLAYSKGTTSPAELKSSAETMSCSWPSQQTAAPTSPPWLASSPPLIRKLPNSSSKSCWSATI